jgi:hypothetical protein
VKHFIRSRKVQNRTSSLACGSWAAEDGKINVNTRAPYRSKPHEITETKYGSLYIYTLKKTLPEEQDWDGLDLIGAACSNSWLPLRYALAYL